MRRVGKRLGAARAIYRSSRAAWVGRREPERIWREALAGEVEFWEHVLPDRVVNHDDYKLRADQNSPMRDPIMNMLIARIPEKTVSIIDVGAGPLTAAMDAFGQVAVGFSDLTKSFGFYYVWIIVSLF